MRKSAGLRARIDVSATLMISVRNRVSKMMINGFVARPCRQCSNIDNAKTINTYTQHGILNRRSFSMRYRRKRTCIKRHGVEYYKIFSKINCT